MAVTQSVDFESAARSHRQRQRPRIVDFTAIHQDISIASNCLWSMPFRQTTFDCSSGSELNPRSLFAIRHSPFATALIRVKP